MKRRLDPVAAVFGVLFILASIFLGDPNRTLEISQLSRVTPVVLILIGLAIVVRNYRSDR